MRLVMTATQQAATDVPQPARSKFLSLSVVTVTSKVMKFATATPKHVRSMATLVPKRVIKAAMDLKPASRHNPAVTTQLMAMKSVTEIRKAVRSTDTTATLFVTQPATDLTPALLLNLAETAQ